MSLVAMRPMLYCRQTLEDQRIRALIETKDPSVKIVEVNADLESQLSEINPDHVYPVLTDRRLIIFGHALDEFIHERWPAPQLLPIEPKRRAVARMLTEWVRGWYDLPLDQQLSHLYEFEMNYTGARFYFGHDISAIDFAARPLLAAWDYDPVTARFADYMDRLQQPKTWLEVA